MEAECIESLPKMRVIGRIHLLDHSRSLNQARRRVSFWPRAQASMPVRADLLSLSVRRWGSLKARWMQMG